MGRCSPASLSSPPIGPNSLRTLQARQDYRLQLSGWEGAGVGGGRPLPAPPLPPPWDPAPDPLPT